MKGKDTGLFLVSAYAPVGIAVCWRYGRTFFDQLDQCLAREKKDDILILGTDTNSSMCFTIKDNSLSVLRKSLGFLGLKHVNNSGRRLCSYLEINNLLALTTYFRKRYYGTWKHPRSKLLHHIDQLRRWEA